MTRVRTLKLETLPASLEIRESSRARRMTLRVDPARDVIQVTTPPGVGNFEVTGFVGRNLAWIHRRFAALPPRQAFVEGGVVPVLGCDHVIRHHRQSGGEIRAGEIRVGGDPAFLARRVRDLLNREARRELTTRSLGMASVLGVRIAALSLRDPRSRWGSCSATGRLSYSWRLILAPEWVVNYVVAHEVSHLKELNHSPRFWALVAAFPVDVGAAQSWLKAQGSRLLRIG
ncbi:MAG: M48 family metallopeptidase [Azospirillaceae bacterium]|nr:M48 family metallopeptidase [Azospirillaceae bacterium]